MMLENLGLLCTSFKLVLFCLENHIKKKHFEWKDMLITFLSHVIESGQIDNLLLGQRKGRCGTFLSLKGKFRICKQKQLPCLLS